MATPCQQNVTINHLISLTIIPLADSKDPKLTTSIDVERAQPSAEAQIIRQKKSLPCDKS